MGVATAVFLVSAALSADLSAAAQLGARPSVCVYPSPTSGESRTSRLDAWEQIREQWRERLCQRLSRLQVELNQAPEQALVLARQLARELPARPEPWALQAQAQVRLGKYAEAWPLWAAAHDRGYDFRSAHALRHYAIAAVMTGHGEIALATYRRLIPWLQAWPDPFDQQCIYVEAANAALGQGPAGLDEAAGYLAAARAGATSSGLRAYVAGMSALLAERRGAAPSADGRLDAAEIWHFISQVRSLVQVRAESPPPRWPVLPRHEVFGAAALLVDAYSSVVAQDLWQEHAAGVRESPADAPWRARTEQRLKRWTAGGAP
jgi:tetratricopeptide (TPR) repeat protein